MIKSITSIMFHHDFHIINDSGDQIVVCKPNGTYCVKKFDDMKESLIPKTHICFERITLIKGGLKSETVKMEMEEAVTLMKHFNKIRTEKGWKPLDLVALR